MSDLPEKTTSSNRWRLLLSLIIIALLVVNAVLLYLNFKSKDENEELTVKNAEVKATLDLTAQKLDSIGNQLDIRIAEVTKYKGDVTSLEKAKADLENEKTLLRSGNRRTEREYSEKIETFEMLLQSKDKEITRLKGVNDQLFTENTTLKTQKNVLNDSISGIQVEKQKLSEKVALASVLKAESLVINAVADNGKEREGGEYKARKVEKIKITCTLAENNVARVESKEIMMRFTEPDGATLFDTGMGGGTFVAADGKETSYTAKQTILFDNTRQAITFVYTKGTPYKTGRHTVELYAEGFRIGSGSFVIK